MSSSFSNQIQGSTSSSTSTFPNASNTHGPFQVQPQSQNSLSNANDGHELPSAFPPGFGNSPNHLLPLQNNHPNMLHMGSTGSVAQPGQANLSFSSQSSGPPFSVQPAPLCKIAPGVNQVNSAPTPAQFFGHSLLNLSQQLIQSMGLPNGQFNLPNPYQNMNRQMPMQLPNMSQLLPYGAPPCSQNPFGGPNQVPQNHTFLANQQMGIQQINQVLQQIKNNLESLIPQTGHVNALNPSSVLAPQLPGTTPVPFDLSLTHQHGNNNFHPQPPGFSQSQGNFFKTEGGNTPVLCSKNKGPMIYTRSPNGMESKMRFQQNKLPHMKNENRKFGFPTKQQGKGFHNKRPDRFSGGSTNQVRNQKRSISWTYSEREIQQWREQRKKNYPSGSTLQKKLEEKHTDSFMVDVDRLRRKELKEILAKQAELGVEVAEIPSHYLSDSEKQQGSGGNRRHPVNGRHRNRADKRGRFDNDRRTDKRGRFDNDRRNNFSKKPKSDTDSSNVANKRKQTLLQKLLSSDINKDNSYLLQAFRFMVMNSFFKDWPDKPLKFPSVIIKENGCGRHGINEIFLPGNDMAEPCNLTKADDHDIDDFLEYSIDKAAGGNDRNEGNERKHIERHEEEEGEIID